MTAQDSIRPNLQIFRDLALEAGAAILEIYNSGDLGVDVKSDDSPVTLADKAADQIIAKGLSAAYPKITLVTEEQAATHEQSAERFIIVDPLDGTKEFINKRDEFTVNIAYVEHGVPVMGVVYAPALSRMFYTDGDGAYEEHGPFEIGTRGTVTQITVAAAQDGEPIHVVASKSHMDPTTAAYIEQYTVDTIKSAGSSLKFCLIATGEAHLYPRCAPTMEWDTAAGDAIARAAGAVMLNYPQMTPFTYGKPSYRNGFFVVAGKITLHTPI